MASRTYGATPMQVAGAYTVFANNGVRIEPDMISSVRTADGDVVGDFALYRNQCLDPASRS